MAKIKKQITFEGLKYNLDDKDRVAASAAHLVESDGHAYADAKAITATGTKFTISSLAQAVVNGNPGSASAANTVTVTNSSVLADSVIFCTPLTVNSAFSSGSRVDVFNVKAGSFQLGPYQTSGSSFANNTAWSASCIVL